MKNIKTHNSKRITKHNYHRFVEGKHNYQPPPGLTPEQLKEHYTCPISWEEFSGQKDYGPNSNLFLLIPIFILLGLTGLIIWAIINS